MIVGLTAAETKPASIFNGKDLSGWNSPDMEKFWQVENGILVGQSVEGLESNYLWSDKSYRDFVLEFEVRWVGEIDTGVELRDPHLQLQLGVSRSLKRDMSGSLYVAKEGYPEAGQAKNAATLMRLPGEWNTFRFEARGDNFKVWINGTLDVDYTDTRFPGAGPLGLQIHGGVKMKVEYRNIQATAL